MTKRQGSLFGAFAGLVLVASCGGGGAAVDKLSTVDKFCTEKAKEECQIASRCVVPVLDCQAARKAECMKFATAATVAPRTYRSSHAQACIDKTRSVYAMMVIPPSALADLNEVCSRVFQGEVKATFACTVDYDCEKALICDKMLCAARVIKPAAALCGNPGEVCAVGSFCTMGAGGAYTCVAKKAMSEACDPVTAPCVEALRCAGTCQPRLAAGMACTSNGDCVTTAPYCDPYFGNKCDQGLSFSPGGAACAGYGAMGGPADGGVDAAAEAPSGEAGGDGAAD